MRKAATLWLVPALCVSLASTGPATAQQEDGAADLEEGMDLLAEGARRVLRGLMGEVEPRMRALAEALEAWDFDDLGIDDLGRYDPPEVLPNGDIIIRRKRPAPAEGEIDL